MRNPWLDVPLADYEAHMALPSIDQARLIADQLGAAIQAYRPDSVAVIGCAGGNGFDRFIGSGVRRVVGVDINPEYIAQARARYEGRIAGLELLTADFQTSALLFEPVDLLFVALVFEYVGLEETMQALRRHCKPNGVVVALCQLPHETIAHVSPSPYTSLQVLAPCMRFVSLDELECEAQRVGFVAEDAAAILSAGGKRFSRRQFRSFSSRADVRARLSELYAHAPRDVYFEAVRAAIAEYYLADPSNPYQQSGRSSGAERWQETRRCIVDAVHRDGDFLDVGCANGLLLESVIGWAAERGFSLRPHGIDFVPELIELARQRLARHASAESFEVANAFYWRPPRQFDFVRTNLEYVQRTDWPELIARQYTAVSDGGRLILCHYRNPEEERVDVRALLTDLGYAVSGHAEASGVSIAWCERHA